MMWPTRRRSLRHDVSTSCAADSYGVEADEKQDRRAERAQEIA
jgi:hypothetical protein